MSSTTNTSPAKIGSVYAKLIAVTAIWGGTFIAGRIVSSHIPPITGAFLRYLVALVVLLLVVIYQEGRLPKLTRREFWGTAALGLTGIFLYNLGFFYALRELPAGRTSLLVSLNPIVTLLGAVLLLGEKLTIVRALGVLLAFCGVFIVISKGDPGSVLSGNIGHGEIVMFGAVSAWAAYTLIGRSMLNTLSPLIATTYATIWGTLFLGIATTVKWQPIELVQFTWQVIASIVFLGVLGTVVAFVWYYQGVKAIGASRASVFNNLVPIFGVTQAAIILGEPVLLSMVVGGAIAITGVILANRSNA